MEYPIDNMKVSGINNMCANTGWNIKFTGDVEFGLRVHDCLLK
jgi:hypothetical protein